MAANSEFITYLNDLLAPIGPLTDGTFFGGHAFKSDGIQFAMVMGNTLYLRVDDTTRPEFEERGAEPFSYATKKKRVFVRTYFSVPEGLLEDQDELTVWARESIDVSKKAEQKKARRKK